MVLVILALCRLRREDHELNSRLTYIASPYLKKEINGGRKGGRKGGTEGGREGGREEENTRISFVHYGKTHMPVKFNTTVKEQNA